MKAPANLFSSFEDEPLTHEVIQPLSSEARRKGKQPQGFLIRTSEIAFFRKKGWFVYPLRPLDQPPDEPLT